ncbi:TetR/AcrR family transcriptional regulator [Gordonia hankookensis]|uniref:Helix-turn-helix transcriptional regulator n=1 Tax=Gordonia hankookensis TaxID=589403 RepID=A0ABR7WHT3_9ACTN|nr:TetR family transcriptional regulator [Gordonia hankookensis]MBD1321452.1 helix-turn-helix transcriptional regulator [Gordonia hankookensis]NDZ96259.1 TetR family transcriptional regulator [Streptomyces sp. SID11726]NEB23528.1 TetR family transcriptional regulator [Streptomyces sp. SID6673]
MGRVRSERVTTTRTRIMSTAERLFAEQGVSTVSNRQISEAAGQGNNYAVGYHFGGRLELVRAILEHHNAAIEPLRHIMVDALGPDVEIRDWIGCLVAPQTDYLGSLGTPTYFARFCAQITIDPKFGTLLYDQAVASSGLMAVLTGLYSSLPAIPDAVLESRDTMARNMILLTLADHERSRAAGEATGSWSDVGHQLIDALVGIWLAPVTHTPE